ncbi:MAG: winged helix-turn-helix transcriptional regulator [Hyphomonadaceae bacterium]
MRALQQNGALTARELERITGIPKSTAWRRKCRLEADGVIAGYRAVVSIGVGDDHVVFVEFGIGLDTTSAGDLAEVLRVGSTVQILRVGLCAYLVRVRGAAGVRELEQAARASGASICRFEVMPVLDEVMPDA